MIRNAPARVPLWLAKRQWRDDRRRKFDGIYWPAPLETCERMRWNILYVSRSYWYRPAGSWQRDRARRFYGYGPLPF